MPEVPGGAGGAVGAGGAGCQGYQVDQGARMVSGQISADLVEWLAADQKVINLLKSHFLLQPSIFL